MDQSVQIWQIITSATLSAVAIVVAGVSLFVSYRNNFGWPPIVLLVLSTRTRHPTPTIETLTFRVEIWNRRKNPISVRRMFVEVDQVVKLVSHAMRDWQFSERTQTMFLTEPFSIQPATQHDIDFELRVQEPPGHPMIPINISLVYYDPRVNKEREIELKRTLA